MDFLQFQELYHHGIKGQRKGVRRFQNEDGSLTPEGRQRYSKELAEVRNQHTKEEAARRATANNKGIKYTYKPLTKAEEGSLVAKKVNETNLEMDANIIKSTGQLASQIGNSLPSGNGKTTHGDYSKISDEELKKRVNRLNMEEQYARLTGDNHYVKSGSEKAREILQTVGSVVAIAGTAVGISAMIYDRVKH